MKQGSNPSGNNSSQIALDRISRTLCCMADARNLSELRVVETQREHPVSDQRLGEGGGSGFSPFALFTSRRSAAASEIHLP